MADDNKHRFILPENLISPSDLYRTIRELETVDDFLLQAKARTPGSPVTLPKTSQVLSDLVETNKLSLLDEKQRDMLRGKLNGLLDNPAKIHISFASTPSSSFLSQVVGWLRQNVHKTAMIEVGLQPSIAAGCIVRTNNKVFDLSLRKHFKMNRQMLSEALEESGER